MLIIEHFGGRRHWTTITWYFGYISEISHGCCPV